VTVSWQNNSPLTICDLESEWPLKANNRSRFLKERVMIDNNIANLQIWDTAGQEKFQSLGYAFYRGSDCCALVFDITNQKSFENLSRWKQGFIEHAAP